MRALLPVDDGDVELISAYYTIMSEPASCDTARHEASRAGDASFEKAMMAY